MSRLQANQHQLKRPELTLRSLCVRRVLPLCLSILAVLLVAACADDDGDRQFATDPRTPKPTEPLAVASPAEMSPIETDMPQASPETLVDRRGSPQTIYAEIDGVLWAFSTEGPRQVTSDAIVAFDASPSGHRVATVTQQQDGVRTRYDIVVLTPDGEVDQRFGEVLTIEAQEATPGTTASSGEDVYLSWAPQGRHLLLAHPSGRLIDVSLDGEVREVETRDALDGLVQADWSPRGDTIGVVVRDQDGMGQLALIEPSDEPAGVNVIAPVGDGSGVERSVATFAWKANGDGVIYLEGVPAEAGLDGGRIVSWDLSTNATRVVATGGQAGPTGSVLAFELAPDGKAIAYSVWLPSTDGWSFNGIYVRSLRHGEVYRVPVDPDVTVVDLWWYEKGLAWAVVEGAPDEASTVEVRVIDGRGERAELGAVALAPGATPMASPAAPDGSPAPEHPGDVTPTMATPGA